MLTALRWELENEHKIDAPVLSYDNATIHGGRDTIAITAAWADGPGALPQRAPLAGTMPDGHKVVEHCFPILKRAFAEKLLGEGGREVTAARAQRLLVEASEECIKADSVWADVQSTELTMQMISTPEGQAFVAKNGKQYIGTGGGWPAAAFR